MPKSLLFIGDSLTEFFDWQHRFPGRRVTNLGRAGEAVEGLRGRLQHLPYQVDNPEMIFIMTGINNIAWGDVEIMQTYRAVLETLINLFPKSRVVVQSILPVIMDDTINSKIRDINIQLKNLAGENGADYLDLFSSFMEKQGGPKRELLLDDGIHLSDKGYEVWANILENFLQFFPVGAEISHRGGVK